MIKLYSPFKIMAGHFSFRSTETFIYSRFFPTLIYKILCYRIILHQIIANSERDLKIADSSGHVVKPDKWRSRSSRNNNGRVGEIRARSNDLCRITWEVDVIGQRVERLRMWRDWLPDKSARKDYQRSIIGDFLLT